MLPQRTLDFFGSLVNFGGYLGFTPFTWIYSDHREGGRNGIKQNNSYLFQFITKIYLWLLTFYELFLIVLVISFSRTFHRYLTFYIIRVLYNLMLCRYFKAKYKMIIDNCDNFHSFVNRFLEISDRIGITGNIGDDDDEIQNSNKVGSTLMRLSVFFFSFSAAKSCFRVLTRPDFYFLFPYDYTHHPVKTVFFGMIQLNVVCYQHYLMALSNASLVAYIFSIRPIMKRLRKSTRPCPQFDYQVSDRKGGDFESFTELDTFEYGLEQEEAELQVVNLEEEETELRNNDDTLSTGPENDEEVRQKLDDDYSYRLFNQLRIIETQFRKTYSNRTLTFEIFELFIIMLNFILPIFWLVNWKVIIWVAISAYFIVVLNAFAVIHGISTRTMSSWTGSGGMNGRWNWLTKFRKSSSSGRRSFRGKNQFYFSSRRLNFTVLSIVVFGQTLAVLKDL